MRTDCGDGVIEAASEAQSKSELSPPSTTQPTMRASFPTNDTFAHETSEALEYRHVLHLALVGEKIATTARWGALPEVTRERESPSRGLTKAARDRVAPPSPPRRS